MLRTPQAYACRRPDRVGCICGHAWHHRLRQRQHNGIDNDDNNYDAGYLCDSRDRDLGDAYREYYVYFDRAVEG